MEAWIEYSQGRLPWAGAVADQDYAVLRGLQIFSHKKLRIEADRLDRAERKRSSRERTREAKTLASRGALPPGVVASSKGG
jgi:hypothetical protein